jgi:RNA 2',3'-cyclic 3'-phosphodiesterase
VRAFVSLMPPARALAELDAVVGSLRVAHPELRWTPTTQWHLTLAFLGEVDEGVLPDLGERIARAARRHPPTSLAFGGGGRFGDRVLWTRVHAAPHGTHPSARESPVSTGRVSHSDSRPTGCESPVSTGRVSHSDRPRGGDDLRRLAASVTAAARRCGIALDERPYRPHLTLARSRDGADLRPAVAALAGFAGSPWTADALHLVQSRLGAGPGGTAVHEVVGTWPLGRAPQPPDPTNGTALGT